jgi:hypothetical protein
MKWPDQETSAAKEERQETAEEYRLRKQEEENLASRKACHFE